MPCYDGRDRDEAETNRQRLKKVEAMLCAVLSTMPLQQRADVVNSINEKESGVSRMELQAWWDRHRREDLERRRQERERQARAEAKKSALAKLTPAERKALGL